MELQETVFVVETVQDLLGFCEIRAVVKDRCHGTILAEIEMQTLDHVKAARAALRYAGISRKAKLRKYCSGKTYREFTVWL